SKIVLGVIYLFILSPLIVTAIFSFNESRFMSFPMTDVSLKWYVAVFNDEKVISALGNSVFVGLAVALTATLLGFIGAYGLTRWQTKRKETISVFLISPLAVPWLFLGL